MRVASFFLSIAAAFAPGSAFVADLQANRNSYAPDQPVRLTVTVENVGDNEEGILSYVFPQVHVSVGRPLSVSELDFDVLEVTRNGESVPYIGKHVKLGSLNSNDFIRVAAGSSVSRVLDLDGAYDLSQDGDYSIRFRTGGLAVEGSTAGHVGGDEIGSNAVSVVVSGRAHGDRNTRGKPTGGRGACDAAQTNLINAANNEAQAYSANSVTYLSSFVAAGNHPRFEEWLGTETQSRFNIALTKFQAISTALPLLTYDCSCKQSYYAYVYPSEHYKVYLCKAFWQTTLTGTDSKAGTLVHETSHFDVVAATDDFVYGQTNCRALADSNENNAISNADSLEYFAENTPYLN